MRFHVVSLPHTQTTKEFCWCAYTQKVLNFCKMLKSLRHTVYLYASEEVHEGVCDELVTCITKKEQEEFVIKDRYFEADNRAWLTMNDRAIVGIMKRREKKDFICLIAGACQQPIAQAMPTMKTVEFGVGYSGVFADFCVYESYAWMHHVYGYQNGKRGGDGFGGDGRFYDAVIPNYYDPDDFPFIAQSDEEPYYLFIGRLIDRKGPAIAAAVCKHLGAKLIIAGQGKPPGYGEHVGMVGVEQRGVLMSRAKAVFVPTLYIGPFEGVNVEAQMCGTPVITTDWGAFQETVEHGKTGFRCRTMNEFIWAALHVDELSRAYIRERALKRYSLEAVGRMYQEYFEQIHALWSGGWDNTQCPKARIVL